MPDGVLLLCTANVCRSPMAAALLSRDVDGRGVAVSSAGLLTGGQPPLPEAVAVMGSYGLDISAHRSRAMGPADLAGAALVLGMTREHVRQAVVRLPEVWPRAFTAKEFVRRAEQAGPRPDGEPLRQWLDRVHAGRDRTSLLGDATADDVADPAGGPFQSYVEAAALLARLMSRAATLSWGPPA